MKTFVISLLFSFYTISVFSQSEIIAPKLNFEYEIVENNQPKDWNTFGNSNYIFSLDSITKFGGNYSASIEFKTGTPDFLACSYILPDNYPGKKIKLSGYIKTENVSDGYAGLWMRIDPSIAFDNMKKNGVIGTSDWKKYEIELEMNPAKTKQIVVGGLLIGKGKMWLDNFSITIDGEKIENLKTIKKNTLPLDNDHEFDKGSRIDDISIDKNHIGNLKIVGLIWGFLKYHHPSIAKGNFNMDYELFRILPQLNNISDTQSRDSILVRWINKFGEIDELTKIQLDSSEIKIKPDLNWITESDFSNELVTILQKIKNAKRSKENYYVSTYEFVGNPNFENENEYSSMKYPDTGFRILSLFRYWNIIQYYFPYKNLIEEDWKNVLDEFIPKIIANKNQTEYTLTLLELIARVHDTHANIPAKNESLVSYFGDRFPAFECKFIEDSLVVTKFSDDIIGKQTGLEIGDIIQRINGKPIKEIISSQLKFTPASNYPTQLRNIARYILRTHDSLITIDYLRDKKVTNTKLITYPSSSLQINTKNQAKDTCFKKINNEIAYINNGTLKKGDLPSIWPDIESTKGLIIDNRNYPSDFPIYSLSSYLMPASSPFVKFSNCSLETPGLFTFSKTLYAGRKNKNYYKGKVLILVNEISQSSAEFHAMAYRTHPNAIVLGSTTAGADGNVSPIYLPGGIKTMISGIGVYYPNGNETQRIGILPDIEYKPTINGIRNGEDDLLNKAIDLINSN